MATANAINSLQQLSNTDNVTHAVINSSISAPGTAVQATTSDSGATAGPNLLLFRNSNSPAAADFIGAVVCQGKSSTGVNRIYAQAGGNIIDATNTAEKGGYIISTMVAGTLTTQVNVLDTGTQVRGNNTNTAPPAGYIGEVLSAANSSGVSLTNNTVANVTSVTLTPGIWLLSAATEHNTTGTVSGNISIAANFATTNNSQTPLSGVNCDVDFNSTSVGPVNGISGIQLLLGPYPLNVASNTTYYLNVIDSASTTFTNVTAKGTIRAVRVG